MGPVLFPTSQQVQQWSGYPRLLSFLADLTSFGSCTHGSLWLTAFPPVSQSVLSVCSVSGIVPSDWGKKTPRVLPLPVGSFHLRGGRGARQEGELVKHALAVAASLHIGVRSQATAYLMAKIFIRGRGDAVLCVPRVMESCLVFRTVAAVSSSARLTSPLNLMDR